MMHTPFNTPNYADAIKKEGRKIVFYISLFIVVYVALALTILIGSLLAIAFAIGIVIYLHNGIAILIAIGILIMAALLVIFLFKFIFKRHKYDRSELIEIFETDEPKLFALVRAVADEVQTEFPKHIYLTTEVNAFVFYDSSFWSMFLPVRKNLAIGGALVNTVTVQEFKAILGHEFGHFSQKSMKLGSYVYQINRVLHDILFDNEGYSRLAGSWASGHVIFNFFVESALFFARGIQKLLIWIYGLINLQNSNLSKAMEFQADQIGAEVAGSKPLADSLLRMHLANNAYQELLAFLEEKILENKTTANLYPQQTFVVQLLARRFRFRQEFDLPQVPLEFTQRFNQSKLNLGNQWESHPSVEERVAHLEAINIQRAPYDTAPASSLFTDFEKTGQMLTAHLFKQVKFTQTPQLQSLEQFEADFRKKSENSSFPALYNGFYDANNPEVFNIDEIPADGGPYKSHSALFNPNILNLLYRLNGLEQDIDTLKSIQEQGAKIRSFDYDGNRYPGQEIPALLQQLEQQCGELKARISQHHKAVYSFFAAKAAQTQKLPELQEHYRNFFEWLRISEAFVVPFNAMLKATQFFEETLEGHTITYMMNNVYEQEKSYKAFLQSLLHNPLFEPHLSAEQRSQLEKFTYTNWRYFDGRKYHEEAVTLLGQSFQIIVALFPQTGFYLKKKLLDFQATLIPATEN